jgi:hypothetical protein
MMEQVRSEQQRQLPMFSVLRTILIIGVIFYYSPVRQGGAAPASLDGFPGGTKEAAGPKPAAAEEPASGRLETIWQVLPDQAKQAVVDRILRGPALGGSAPKATDTLLPTDRQLASHGKGQ